MNENSEEIESLDKEFVSEIVVDPLINPAFKLLKYLDPYGDTVFNHLQMDDLILDFKELKEIRYDESIHEIIQLALTCKAQAHSYLTFYGD